MEGDSSASDGVGAKPAGGRTKSTGISTFTRLQRNQAEKERRDKLNGYISELAKLIPMVSNSTKPLDKVSILRLAAAEMRLNFSCLNPKKNKNKLLALPPAITSSLDLIEKSVGGFVIVTTLSGFIVFCSKSIENYLGYQNIELMGNKMVKFIYGDDVKYFEAKVKSVIKSSKKSSKKKTRVIKVHMLQKPPARSNKEGSPRNMIIKISMHQNDVNETSGDDSEGRSSRGKTRESKNKPSKKIGPPKNFGYSAVVLMFVEPVRLEPEIDMTYIDINQDVYFTRHGLQGEIIYADQRISTITGYLPHDVKNKSAYEFICPSDVPIALFAQKAMFTSSDGKGDIVYRLKIRDMRYIYLQSSGQIAYKESTSEISHFVCLNRLLSEEEGSHELKKFQQCFAPQIMAAKLLQTKQNDRNQSPNTELAYVQAMAIMSSSKMPDVVSQGSQVTPLELSKVSSPEIAPSACDQALLSDACTSAPDSIYSTEGHHSIESSNGKCRLSSIGSDCSGYTNEQMDFVVETQEQRSSLRLDVNSFPPNTYEATTSIKEDKIFRKEELVNNLINLHNSSRVKKPRRVQNVDNCNGSYVIQSDSFVNAKSMHSVNAFSNLQNSSKVLKSYLEELFEDLPMDFNFENGEIHDDPLYNTALNSTSVYVDQSSGFIPPMNDHPIEHPSYNGQGKNETRQFVSFQDNLKFPVVNATASAVQSDERVDFTENQILRKQLLDPLNLRTYEDTSNLSLTRSSSYTLSNDISDAVNYNSLLNSYQENGSFTNCYLSKTGSDYVDDGAHATTTTYSDLDGLDSKMFSSNLYELTFPMTVDSSYNSANAFNAMDTSTEISEVNPIPEQNLVQRMGLSNSDFTRTPSVKSSLADRNGTLNFYSDTFSTNVSVGNRSGDLPELVASIDVSLNNELYENLDTFFQNLPQSNSSQNSNFVEPSFGILR